MGAPVRYQVPAKGTRSQAFFFEKKNQKTYSNSIPPPCPSVNPYARRHLQKFFASFFQKRRILPFFLRSISPRCPTPKATEVAILILFGLLAALSSVLVRLMVQLGALDHPVARSSHSVATPKGGGVGIVAAYAVGTLWLLYIYTVPIGVLAPLLAGLPLAVISYIDDVRPGPFVIKLAAQIAAAVGVILAGDHFGVIAAAGSSFSLPGLIGAPLAMVWLLFVTNAVNFMDGLNGLASGSLLVGLASVIATGRAPLAAEALPLLAGIVGFLPWNYPWARIFMGDVGSQFCGFIVADLAIRAAGCAAVSLVLPLCLLPLLADVAFTLLRRAYGGARLTEAHRGHIYQVAHRAGVRAPVIAALYWAMALFGGICGMIAGRLGLFVSVGLSLMPIAVWFAYVAVKARRAGITRW